MRSLDIGSTGMMAQQTNVDVISNNISNVDTIDYRRMRVDFDKVMGEVLKAYDGEEGEEAINAALARVQPVASPDTSSPEVFLDKEIVALVENTLNYQALINARGKLGEITKLAISGGK